MKAGRIWVACAALLAGCVPLGLAPGKIESRALAEKEASHALDEAQPSTRVRRRLRALPGAVARTEIEFGNAGALAVSQLAARLSETLDIEVVLEERGSRGEGQTAGPPDPSPIPVASRSTVGKVLDEMSARAGYAWEWEEDPGSGAGRLILYREHHRPDSEGQAFGWGSREEWRIDPVRHGTLRGVLEAWSARAGWTLVWEAEEIDYALQAPAVYLGTFDAAVDALLRETKGRRMLIPTLWRANRYLTVREAG